jgi:signal transduction histidine kinase
MNQVRFRRRLRSRIIISFALFGFALTALFAVAAIYLRARLEDQLINNALEREVKKFVDFKREHPEPDALYFIHGYDLDIKGARYFANVPFERRQYDTTGVYDIDEPGDEGKVRPYKLAVYKDADYWAFVRLDISTQKLGQRQLFIALIGAVLIFGLFSLLIGRWLSRRVMSPVTDLAQRIRTLRQTGKPEPLAPHFANDEVGELASALDAYSDRLTDLVVRDREFNADVSHELRTPLAVISSTTELLLASTVDDKLRDRLKRIERAAKQSTELTNALLLLSRSERSAPLDGETTDVAKVAEQVIETFRSHIGKKAINVQFVVDQPIEVVAPSSVVAVALGNLIGNAFKYTPAGDVIITIGAGRGKVTVEDSGPGIKPEEAEKLFERGVRGDSSAGSKGAGLGLAIVRRLCELHEWRVSLAPRPQGGAVATLDFRLRA